MAIDKGLLEEFSYGAVPVHSPREHERLPLDPRLAKRFLHSGSIAPEVREHLTSYIVTAKWTAPERAVYSAILDEFADVPAISGVTGMSEAKVNQVITSLSRKGMVRRKAP